MSYAKSNRFQAKPQIIDGIRFGSRLEAKRYSELKLLERARDIRNLELQPRFDITINGIKCGFYKADFAYFREEQRIVEDVKGYSGDTETYRLKKRIIEALYSIKIAEIGKRTIIQKGFPPNGKGWTESTLPPSHATE